MEDTELIVLTGECFTVRGTIEEVETKITGASRGALMQLAWLEDANSGRPLAVNPHHVVALRTAPEPPKRDLAVP